MTGEIKRSSFRTVDAFSLTNGQTKTVTCKLLCLYLIVAGQPYSDAYMAICVPYTSGQYRLVPIKTSGFLTVELESANADNATLKFTASGNEIIRIVEL